MCLFFFLHCVAGCVRMVKGEGMPQYRNPFEKGDLYIKFDVQFPENNWIDADKLNVINSSPPSPNQHVTPFHLKALPEALQIWY